eukprot:NODE_596_length_1572_cov_65.801707_g491_i0.p1 GENE.NODE_596_length_1572_cov_65.801707_g491_i0~~NODE_596_length_1572_cov_65.801707_g491_i0.p1  ORF type:complete len:284 (+),score=33.92 NODE_596_length_1572_cov_65.801707_g491_i0:569-1420(+)
MSSVVQGRPQQDSNTQHQTNVNVPRHQDPPPSAVQVNGIGMGFWGMLCPHQDQCQVPVTMVAFDFLVANDNIYVSSRDALHAIGSNIPKLGDRITVAVTKCVPPPMAPRCVFRATSVISYARQNSTLQALGSGTMTSAMASETSSAAPETSQSKVACHLAPSNKPGMGRRLPSQHTIKSQLQYISEMMEPKKLSAGEGEGVEKMQLMESLCQVQETLSQVQTMMLRQVGCVVCDMRCRSVVLIPCKCMCLCEQCSSTTDSCPSCRATIEKRLHVCHGAHQPPG